MRSDKEENGLLVFPKWELQLIDNCLKVKFDPDRISVSVRHYKTIQITESDILE